MSSNNVVIKAGATKAEATANRLQIELEQEQKFKELLNQDPIAATFREVQPGEEAFVDTLVLNLRKAGLTHAEVDSVLHGRAVEEQGLPYTPQPQLERKLEAQTEGSSTWREWLSERQASEQVRQTTVNGWEGSLKRFSEWLGSEYLAVQQREMQFNTRRIC